MIKASMFSSADASRLTSLVQTSQEPVGSGADGDEALGAPDPAVYKGHSRGIIETLDGAAGELEGPVGPGAEDREAEHP